MKKISDFNKKAFGNYMVVHSLYGMRGNIIALIIGMLDIFILLPALAPPFQSIYVYILVPPIAFLNLWGIWIIINPRKRQVQYTLFRGAFGIVCSAGLLIVAQKFAYTTLKLQTPLYFIFSFSLYFFALYYYYQKHVQKLCKQKKKSVSSRGIGSIGVASIAGAGQIIGGILIGSASQQVMGIVMMSIYSMLSFMSFHFIMELHRYYYLRRYIKDEGARLETSTD
ncbi:hypothetical protein [Priestia taiwanensis]|uniref:Uncharacterized protein n=1 Tax=Priestia taiwanensis TaxID=1347902 RepID=A0A917ELW3_9BACI|nr:hypothetical protein [Priestia taiwanensis]MBM7362122.1 hypothetical protein [Priestia taiwanensis]GGE59650.1 hypothetical protein GCM10007140_07450 [Priestia taiwanensis]